MADIKYFNFEEAFSRNIGWVTAWEQQILRSKRVAIAGVGGVGGVHLLTLARLGIGHFNIADLDRFELANFNRQAGAMVSTLGQEKVDVLERMAKDINPQLDIKIFPQGLTPDNLDEFLKDVDLYVDGLDAFVLDMRSLVYKRAYELGIPAVTAGPLGMAVVYMAFMPHEMTFEEYFGLEGKPFVRQAINFIYGLAPKSKHFSYLKDPTRLDFSAKKGPSTPMACQLASGVIGAQALKILLKRGEIFPAPWSHCFDPYLNRWVLSQLSGGSKNIFQRIKTGLVYRAVCKMRDKKAPEDPLKDSIVPYEGNVIEQILDLARWAPSGDNLQRWQFQIINDEEICIHFAQGQTVFDQGDFPALLNVGILLENLKIAASGFDREMVVDHIPEIQWPYRVVVRFQRKTIGQNPLLPFIKVRSVNRGHYQLKALDERQKKALQESLGEGFNVQWYESLGQRFSIARMAAVATHIRLSCEEVFDDTRKIIDWENNFSPDKLPAKTLGVSELTRKILKWTLQDWSRMNFLNTYVAGTVLPQIELELIPGYYSSAYFIITSKNVNGSENKAPSLIKAGGALQRFWLTLTQLGLSMQPSYSSLIFSLFVKYDIPFSKNKVMQEQAKRLSGTLEQFAPVSDVAYIGRIGYPQTTYMSSRSIRKPLSELLKV